MSVEFPPVKANPAIDTDVLFSIHPELLDDSYMYVHIHVKHAVEEMLIRIWKSTFLIGKNGEGKTGLVHAENITYAPVWTLVPKHFDYVFLLIFGGLPKSCRVFDLVEEISQPGAFYVGDIPRNETDVYHIDLSL